VQDRNESSARLVQLVTLAIVALVLTVLVLILLTLANQIFPPWSAYLG
jgi:nitrate/nitrite-specific signal transduction histidine kinase